MNTKNKPVVFYLFITSTVLLSYVTTGLNITFRYFESIKGVYSHNKLDSQLHKLNVVSYADLPPTYREYTQSEIIRNSLEPRKFYAINLEQMHWPIVGYFEIKDFLSKDSTYQVQSEHKVESKIQYWLMDSAVLHRFLDLLLWMRKKGLNDSAITVNHGFRNYAYNMKVGGVRGSQHLYGRAIDIKVGDINRDGNVTKEDKKMLLDVLDKEIIGNTGGLGLYPNSDVIHIDTRGYRARWNSH